MTHARISNHIAPGEAVKAILEAKEYFNFNFKMVQCDNGLEFSRYFEQTLARHNILVRYSRLGRPNDNAQY